MRKFIHKLCFFARHIQESSKNERAVASIVFVFKELFGVIFGRISALMLGWPRSTLGRESKVIGSKGITVGEGSCFKRYAWIEAVFKYNQQNFTPEIRIGRRCYASERLHISAISYIEIGDGCLFGSGVYISDHNHGAYRGELQSSPLVQPIDRNLVSFGAVTIGSNVWVGDNVVIIGPVKVGNGVVIGANSVVTKDIPDNIVGAGAPLKFLKEYNHSSKRWEKCSGQNE